MQSAGALAIEAVLPVESGGSEELRNRLHSLHRLRPAAERSERGRNEKHRKHNWEEWERNFRFESSDFGDNYLSPPIFTPPKRMRTERQNEKRAERQFCLRYFRPTPSESAGAAVAGGSRRTTRSLRGIWALFRSTHSARITLIYRERLVTFSVYLESASHSLVLILSAPLSRRSAKRSTIHSALLREANEHRVISSSYSNSLKSGHLQPDEWLVLNL